jgi:geranylgeranyl diphosphate synthase type II
VKGLLARKAALVEEALAKRVPAEGSRPARLVAAMRHSLFAGGKRIRPVLCLAAAEACGGRQEDALFAACALEMVHTYSLIHDDLPAMDDDDVRRGRPTCHKAFDEATAILAGDALLTLSFEVLAHPAEAGGIAPAARMRLVRELALAAGWRGMVGGQQVDMESEGGEPDFPTLEYIHTRKTGALIRASVLMGGLCAGASRGDLRALGAFGGKLGLAFQLVDDVLDLTATTEELGKDAGSDLRKGKMTWPALFGLADSRERARELVEEAKSALAPLPEPALLADIADYVLLRRI